jgi:hypothetical protein
MVTTGVPQADETVRPKSNRSGGALAGRTGSVSREERNER